MMIPALAQTLGIPQPEPLPLPAPPWLIWILLIVTFLLHVVAMNVILGGSVITALSRIKGSDDYETFFRTFVKILPVAIAATITLGVPPLLFVQVLYGRLLYTSSVLMGWFWFSVIPLLIIAYYGSYVLAFKTDTSRKWKWLIWLVAVILLFIAFIYTNNMSLMLRPDVFLEKYLENGRGFHLNVDTPMLVPRYLHNIVSATAVASMGLALLGLLKRRKAPEFGSWAIRKGAVWFGIATVVNLGVGTWFLFSLSRDILLALMNPVGVAVLMIGIVAALFSVFLVMQAINAADPGVPILGAAVALVVSLIGMILLRDQLRQAYLNQAGYEIVKWIVPDWVNILIFVALFVVAIGTVVWMVAVLVRGRSETIG